jgi:hypothetical protein
MNRLMLAAYPKAYRAAHGEELLACLAEAHLSRKFPATAGGGRVDARRRAGAYPRCRR